MKLPGWPRPSTLAFIREARRTPGYRFFDWLHGYVYARWPYLYIGIGTGEHPLTRVLRPLASWFEQHVIARVRRADPTATTASPEAEATGSQPSVTFADTYHGKVVTLQAATRLVSVNRELEVRNLEHIIPFTIARDLVLKDPDHIAVLDCPCRVARADPCRPLDVCLIVGEPFASFVVEHHSQRARWITPDEAVQILVAEHERGHVHHAFFKDAMLGRFYAICNCCTCCCGAMQAQRHGVPMLISSGYVAHKDAALCLACGSCAEWCQFGAIRPEDGTFSIDEAACMGCGVCVDKCPSNALHLVRDPGRPAPLELNQLPVH